jgi:hypothetical protein
MGVLKGTKQFAALPSLQFMSHGLADEAAAVAFDPVDAGHQLCWHGDRHPLGRGTSEGHGVVEVCRFV